MSELKLEDLYNICNDFCPIEVRLNDITVYQEEDFANYKEANARFKEIFTWKYLITEINVKIVHFHHSIINLYGYEGDLDE